MQIYFSGGEPMIFKDFPILVNQVSEKHGVIGFVSNISAKYDEYKKINKKLNLNVSFHREHTDIESFCSKCIELSKHFNIMINYVATHENIETLDYVSAVCKKYNMNFHVDVLLEKDLTHTNYSNEEMEIINKYCSQDRVLPDFLISTQKKLCSAGKNYICILPDGSVYPCATLATKFIENGDTTTLLGNIFENTFNYNKTNMLCDSICLGGCDYDYTSVKKYN